jgi:hypothetical protein
MSATDGAEAVPAWLAAWRERGRQPPRAAARPVQPRKHPGQGGSRTAAASAAVAAAQRPKANWHGFAEPERWPYDGGVRRESVLDCDFHPPRVVRQVGWRACMCCGTPFFSEDVMRLRLCDGPDGCRGAPPIEYRRKAAVNKETTDDT